LTGNEAQHHNGVQLRHDAAPLLRLVGAVALAPMLVMLALLQARGAWFAAAGGVFLYLCLYRRLFIALLPVMVLSLVLLNVFSQELGSALPFQLDDLPFIQGLQGRQMIWEFAAREIVREPLGHGTNTFRLYAENLASDLLTTPQRQHAHNLFLQAGFEIGLIGLAAFAALFGYTLYASGHAVVRGVKHDLSSAVIAALCAVLVSVLLEANMWGNRSALVLWGLFGMAVVLGRYGARRRRRQRGRSLREGVPGEM
jgi:O-antigen ligase